MTLYRTVFISAVLVLALGGATEPVPLAEKGGILIEDARVTASRPNAPAAAVFLTIENTGPTDDRLISVETEAAARAELHSSEMQDGVSMMRPMADGLAIPAGASVQLEGGGLHVMLMGLTAPLANGGSVALTLHFEQAGDVTVAVPVSLLKAVSSQEPSP